MDMMKPFWAIVESRGRVRCQTIQRINPATGMETQRQPSYVRLANRNKTGLFAHPNPVLQQLIGRFAISAGRHVTSQTSAELSGTSTLKPEVAATSQQVTGRLGVLDPDDRILRDVETGDRG